jgi:hypothetical protein
MPIKELKNNSLETLKETAIEKLNLSAEEIKKWAGRVRPDNGKAGRFKWAVRSTRDANAAGTKYILGALENIGIYEGIITGEDKKAGIEWINSMHLGNERYRDPAICDRAPPGWSENKPWPSSDMEVIINQYAQGVIRSYSKKVFPNPPPPTGWPQPDDPTEKMVDWIKSRRLDQDPWGAGSHAMRAAVWMLQWYSKGRIPADPLLEVIEYFYEKQDPETGLWGSKDRPLFERINGTFKLFILLQYALDLPLSHAEKIIDNTIGEFYRPDYDSTAGGCDEFDNWYVIALAERKTDGYRAEEIKKLSAYRITRVLDLYQKSDGGLSYYTDRCAQSWGECDMAPPVSQGDAVALGTYASGINICIDILGIKENTSWSGEWGHNKVRPPDNIREKIKALVLAKKEAIDESKT